MVTVIYDMMAEQVALNKYPPLRGAYVRRMSRFAARHSDAVVTISEHSRREIAQWAGIPQERIVLAPPAAGMRREGDAAHLQAVRERYRLPERFILYLGTMEPGKNLPFLVRAYGRLKRARPETEQHLVLAGAQGWGTGALEAEIVKSDAGGFHAIGFVDEEDIAALYTLADVFVYPSLYEGFGLPPLEAMACGTPVIVSNVSALPEVVGRSWMGKPAGEIVSPDDEQAWADALAWVLGDETRREAMRTAGLARAGEFSWEMSAQVVRDTLERVGRLTGTGRDVGQAG
jgi:glycosyltransferase involved in cell wall biosynthesis